MFNKNMKIQNPKPEHRAHKVLCASVLGRAHNYGLWSKIKNYNRGVSLLFTILIMALLLGISLGVSIILVQGIKIIRGIGESVTAFYAADTGIEKVTMNRENPSDFQECFPAPYNDICYQVKVISPGPDCQTTNYCLQSTGSYKATKRAIELKY